MRKTVSLIIVLTFLLIGMFTLVLNSKPVKSYSETWTVDDHEASGISKVQNALTTITEIDPSDLSRFSRNPTYGLTIKSLFKKYADSESLGNFRLPYEATMNWNLNNGREKENFITIDDNSVELVIGLEYTQQNRYSELENLVESLGGDIINTISVGGRIIVATVNIPIGTMSIFTSEMQITGLSRYIEPNIRYEINFVPNDPHWSKQWGLHTIEAEYAWNSTTRNSSVLVAVVDTGVDWNHPDLSVNYVPLGYDWVNNDPDPMDDHGHGTHCAGVIAATLNNGVGIAGLARVQIMAEKSLDQYGSGSVDDLARAIVHAVDQGADILSCSWGGYGKSTVIHEALKYAYDHGVLVIGAAGNDATSVMHYPAAYDEVVAVTATDMSDDPAGFTNFGGWVEVSAPGVHIYSTVWDDSYGYMSGTSMSTPHVSGVAALIWSQFPDMTRDQVRAQLRSTVDELGVDGYDIYYGYGRVNAKRAVEQDQSDHDLLVLKLNEPRYVNVGNQVMINTTILNMGVNDESGILVQLFVNGSAVDFRIIAFLESGATALVSFSWTPVVNGVYNLTSYIIPVPSENMTKNNALLAYVPVRIPEVIRVPDDYGTIQGAVDAAMDGDTIFVASGTYYENVWIDKENLALLGEDQVNTIINGRGLYDVLFVVADNVRIDGFTIRNSGGWNPSVYPPFSGIMVYSSNGQKISNTTTSNNCVGICLFQSNGVTLRDNQMTSNLYNFGVEGYHVMDFTHDIDISNSVKGKPIYYWTDQRVNHVPTDAGYVAAVNSFNITVKDLNLTSNYQGILLAYSNCSLIENVRASNNYVGIHLVHSHVTTVDANTVTNSQIGIQLQNSNSNDIIHNTITYGYEGLSLYYSSNNLIRHNNMYDNIYGHSLEKSSNNTIEHNTVFNNTYGIYIRKSSYNTLRNNNLTHNSYNFGVIGSHLSHFIEDIDTSNTVNRKPIYYWVKQKEKEIPRDAGYVAVVNSTNITVKNLNPKNNIHGILFAYTQESLIENVNTSNNMYSLYLHSSSDNTITRNTIASRGNRGIQIINSENNTISNNVITNNYISIGLWSNTVN
ncbi:MAG: S8 family serine peptidase, partial [Candidatus Bathyarchaeota archaeon]